MKVSTPRIRTLDSFEFRDLWLAATAMQSSEYLNSAYVSFSKRKEKRKYKKYVEWFNPRVRKAGWQCNCRLHHHFRLEINFTILEDGNKWEFITPPSKTAETAVYSTSSYLMLTSPLLSKMTSSARQDHGM
ncbi:hypothetical protein TNCV_2053981 [Trichonephila clavipes]|nr:hypothetical protein TNCV_2053981 [Trichonephila clavipes]